MVCAGLFGVVLAAASAGDASGARAAAGPLVDKVLVVASAVITTTRATVPAIAASASVGAPTVPAALVATAVVVSVAATAVLPAAVFFAGLRDELAEGVFGAFVEASIGSIGVAVLDPGGGCLGISAVRIVPLGEGSLVRGLLLLIVAGAAYEGARDEPGEDQDRQDAQYRR